MPDETDAPEVPTEEETLTGEDGFDFDKWKLRAASGKYDGYEVAMAAFLSTRAISRNTRRWKLNVWGLEVTEDNLPLEATFHAETYTGQLWGFLEARFGINPELSRQALVGLLYGIGLVMCGWSDPETRAKIRDLRNIDLIDMVTYYQDDTAGKGPGSEEPTTT